MGQKNIIKRQLQEIITDRLLKAFIIFRLLAFSRTARNEGKNFYFYDNGIRNVINPCLSGCGMYRNIIWEFYGFFSNRNGP